MLSKHDKYPIPCARVHGAMGADSLSLRASAARFAHQNEQRSAAEFGLFDLGGDPTAVGCAVRLTRIVPFRGFAAHPVGAFQSAGRASFGDHRSASEAFAGELDQDRGVGLPAGDFAQQFQARGRVGQQNEDVAPLAWVNALVGWARCGERRHLTVTAGAMLMLALTATLAMGV